MCAMLVIGKWEAISGVYLVGCGRQHLSEWVVGMTDQLISKPCTHCASPIDLLVDGGKYTTRLKPFRCLG